jgi:hypothetical protein
LTAVFVIVQPKRNVALGLVTCVLTLFVTCLGTIFCVLGHPPGIAGVAKIMLVYEPGFKAMFNIGHFAAVAISLPRSVTPSI